MTKVLAVLGATGQQGSSVIEHVRYDKQLSETYTVRALTRDPSSDKAQLLLSNNKVEVIQADVTDRSSLEGAFTGVHTLFAMTTPAFGSDAVNTEYNTIKQIADAAVAKGVTHIIFSTLPAVSKISGGKYKAVTPFDAKALGEEYIRSLPVKSSFYCPGSFMTNFTSQPFSAPQKSADNEDTWVMKRNMRPDAQMPLIDAVGDGGKFVGAILADPDKYVGKTICAATKLYSLTEQAAALAKASGKKVVYQQISDEELVQASGLPAPVATLMVEYFKYVDEFGYFGPGTKELVEEGARQVERGELATLEDYLERHSYTLS